jgi:hypothetical protein
MVALVLNYSVDSYTIYLPWERERENERLCHIIRKDVNRVLVSISITHHLSLITVDNGQNNRDQSFFFLFSLHRYANFNCAYYRFAFQHIGDIYYEL